MPLAHAPVTASPDSQSEATAPVAYTTYNGIKVMMPMRRDGEIVDPDAPLKATALYYDRLSNMTFEVQVPTAIAPPHLRLNKRKEKPGPLFGSSGGPVLEDVQQSELPSVILPVPFPDRGKGERSARGLALTWPN